MPIEPATLPSKISVAVTAGTAGPDDVADACALAIRCGCSGVIVNPCFVADAMRSLRPARTMRCEATVSFPLGCDLPAVKLYAAEQSILMGCCGILLAVNTGLILSGATDVVRRDLSLVSDSSSAPMSVWVDAAALSDEQLTQTVHLAVQSGAASVVCCSSDTREIVPEQVTAIVDATNHFAHLRIAGPTRSIEHMSALIDAGADGIVLTLSQAKGLLPDTSQQQ